MGAIASCLYLSLFLSLSLVRQVNFEGTRAVGASFTRFGRPGTVSAKREVILSAGTVGSTQLLLLSGLGPKEELKRLQVSSIRRLFEHSYSGALTFEKRAVLRNDSLSVSLAWTSVLGFIKH